MTIDFRGPPTTSVARAGLKIARPGEATRDIWHMEGAEEKQPSGRLTSSLKLSEEEQSLGNEMRRYI